MEILPNHPNPGEKRLSTYGEMLVGAGARPYGVGDTVDEEVPGTSIDPGRLLRKYWWVLLLLLLLGGAAGFTSVIFSSPMYRARLLLEVQSVSVMTKSALEVTSYEANDVNLQTQITILRSGPFLKRGADRMQSETVPLAPTGRDLFSRLRQRVRPATQDPLENARRGLVVAIGTFDARPVTRTRLIELSCDSTSPDVAAQFLNAMAAEFVDDTSRSRMQSSQKTSEWLSAQIEETKSKLQDSEERLRDFVQASGNLFAGQETTLDDTKLAQLKGELAKIQSERIGKQSRYELTLKSPPEALAEVLDDTTLKGYQNQIANLKRERAALLTTYTPKHEKVVKLDAQLTFLEKTYENEITSVVRRIRNDYEAALRQERLLTSAYNGQSQRVGAEAGKAAQYNALKREVETLRQMYQSLLMEGNQAALSSSVPINPIRIVEPSSPPEFPYLPRPPLNISFGLLAGLVLTAGIIFLRERMDHSIKSPVSSRRLLNTRQLGVIPNLAVNGNGLKRVRSAEVLPTGDDMSPGTALLNWRNAPAFIAESFRGTLASILRNQANGTTQKTILVTSAGSAEGKTTVVQNLGIALAETGRKVLVVDADFRRPHLHHRFDMPNDLSLVDMLSDDTPFSEYPPERWGLESGFPGLWVLPNRPSSDSVAKVLYSPRLRAVFEALAKRYDMILVDAPPILHLADARIIAPLTDAVILVLRCGVTDRESALEAYQRIREDGLFLLGTVLTDWRSTDFAKRQYDYDYADENQS